MNFASKNEKLWFRNVEFCIKNAEFRSKHFMDQAVAAAKAADTVVLVMGIDGTNTNDLASCCLLLALC